MKVIHTIVGLCLAVSANVQADVFASADNEAGGKIVLSDRFGICTEGRREAMTITSDGTALGGCWRVFEKELIQIDYHDNTTKMYSLEGWVLGPKYRKEASSKGNPI